MPPVVGAFAASDLDEARPPVVGAFAASDHDEARPPVVGAIAANYLVTNYQIANSPVSVIPISYLEYILFGIAFLVLIRSAQPYNFYNERVQFFFQYKVFCSN